MTQTAHLVYLSPTGTTRRVVAKIAEGIKARHLVHHDLTRPGSDGARVLTEGVAIIGVPVYAGRVPELFLHRFQGVTASGMPAVLVALYGNREFEDALVELCDLAVAQGFTVIAAGAFIGEHSYSTPDRPIAAGRPNDGDLSLAREFGQRVADKIAKGICECPPIEGNHPYRERVKLGGIAPETDPEKCALCGQCATVCPSGVITVSGSVDTDATGCIMCCACLRTCSFDARYIQHPRVEEKRAQLYRHCRLPKAPKLFL